MDEKRVRILLSSLRREERLFNQVGAQFWNSARLLSAKDDREVRWVK